MAPASGRFPGQTMHYTRFERARILGARSLQLALGAPSLLQGAPPGLDAVDLAIKEFSASCIPLTVQRSLDGHD